MEEIGKVVKIYDNFAIIEMEPNETCRTCRAKMFCNPAGAKRQIEVINKINAKIGDIVKIEVESKITLLSGFLIFIAPLISFAFGYIISNLFAKDEFRILFGFIFLIIYLFLLKLMNTKVSRTKKFSPVIKQIIT